MNLVAQEYYQHNQRYLSTVMPLKMIKENSSVLIYGKNDYGYQRDLDQKHIDNLKKNLLNDKDQTLLPTSIILSIDEKNLSLIETKYTEISKLVNDEILGNIVLLNLQNSNLGKNLFRIVDGQHRIEGLIAAYDESYNDKFINFQLSVIILIIPNNNRSIEVNVFNDINSTQKKLKTDLIELVRAKYILLGETPVPVNNKDVVNYLAMNAAILLNEDSEFETGVWRNAIQLEGSAEARTGIIGISAFKKAILPCVRFFYNRSELKNNIKDNATTRDINELNRYSVELAEFFNNTWEIVRGKWGNCFIGRELADDLDYVYLENYYLQKTTGTNAIMRIFFDLLKLEENTNDLDLTNPYNREKFINKVLENFSIKLNNSPIIVEDWQNGGPFTGLTSGAGFKIATNIIIPTKKEKKD